MAALIKSLFIFLSFLLNKPVTSLQPCTPTSCSPTGPQIRFPFGLNSDNSRCSFPGYGLSCNNENQTILNLRYSGDFIVRYINYQTQEIHIRDPGNCLAVRFLKNFSPWGSPFIGEFDQSFIFLNCPVKNISTVPPLPYPYARLVGCMSNENETVVAFPSEYEQYAHSATACTVMASGVKVPVAWSRVAEGYTTLLWTEPDCAECEQSGGTCGFKYESGPIIGCHDQPGRGLPRTVKYGLIIGVGIPGLLCIIGLGCYLCGRVRTYNRSRHFSTDLSTTMPHLPSMFATGLDEPTIELYPKTLLGESRRLPKPNDNICPICLSEYQSKETLRTIPECNHYFHAECIDEWLKMNATCPLCRNSPHLSSIATPTSSSSSSSLGTPSSLSASSSSLFSGR